MIINKENFDTIANKFSELMKKVTLDTTVPHYFNVWEEHGVEAIINVAGKNISYSITIKGKKICTVDVLISTEGTLYQGTLFIVEKLTRGSKKYVDEVISEEAISFIKRIQYLENPYTQLTKNMVAHVHTVKTQFSDIKFVDIWHCDKLIYSAPVNTGSNVTLLQILKTILETDYLNGELSIRITR